MRRLVRRIIEANQKPSRERQVNYPHDSFHLQYACAKKDLTQVFQVETNVPTDGLPLRECRSTSRVLRSAKDAQTKSAADSYKEKETVWTGKDMSAFSIVLMLLLLGIFAAAHTDRPVFWLLVGPAPLAVGFTLTTFLRQGFGRQNFSEEKRKTGIASDNSIACPMPSRRSPDTPVSRSESARGKRRGCCLAGGSQPGRGDAP
jgi:hypothetical protein